MKYKEKRNGLTGAVTFMITIEEKDMVIYPFDKYERKLLEECKTSNKIADKLLGLEMVARKIESNLIK